MEHRRPTVMKEGLHRGRKRACGFLRGVAPALVAMLSGASLASTESPKTEQVRSAHVDSYHKVYKSSTAIIRRWWMDSKRTRADKVTRGPLVVNKERAQALGLALTPAMGIEECIDRAGVLHQSSSDATHSADKN